MGALDEAGTRLAGGGVYRPVVVSLFVLVAADLVSGGCASGSSHATGDRPRVASSDPAATGPGTVQGRVVQGCREPFVSAACQSNAGLGGRTVNLRDERGVVMATARTGDDGSFRFQAPSGSYQVEDATSGARQDVVLSPRLTSVIRLTVR